MTWKALLLKLLDAAETAFPQFKFLLDLLRPYLTAAAPDGVVVMGGAAPDEVTALVVEFLTSLLAKTTRPLVKVGLRVLIGLTPYLVSLAWSALFPDQPKLMTAGPAPDFDAVLAAADTE